MKLDAPGSRNYLPATRWGAVPHFQWGQYPQLQPHLETHEMRQLYTTEPFGPAAFMADKARIRVGVSYLGSRWVQAPISDRREADT